MLEKDRPEDLSKYPVKKCHCLEGKHFVVIDESIIERLGIQKFEDWQIYFQQELTQDNSIILRIFRLKN